MLQDLFESFGADKILGNQITVIKVPQGKINSTKLLVKNFRITNATGRQIVMHVYFIKRFFCVFLIIPKGMIKVEKHALILFVNPATVHFQDFFCHTSICTLLTASSRLECSV